MSPRGVNSTHFWPKILQHRILHLKKKNPCCVYHCILKYKWMDCSVHTQTHFSTSSGHETSNATS